MPHCIVEYSKELALQVSPEALVDGVFNGVINSGFVEAGLIKARAIAYEHYRIGAAQRFFIHVSIRLLSGRPAEQRSGITTAVLAGLQALNVSDVSITVEILDMERESFAKGAQ